MVGGPGGAEGHGDGQHSTGTPGVPTESVRTTVRGGHRCGFPQPLTILSSPVLPGLENRRGGWAEEGQVGKQTSPSALPG